MRDCARVCRSRGPLRRALEIGAAATLLGAPLGGQVPDSVRLMREAHAAQRDFEVLRKNHLPWGAAGGGGSGRCDAQIGRYCYWHGDAPDHGPPDAPVVAAGRVHLLAVLDSAGRASPADGWIAGERVRYWLDAGAPDSALAAIRFCGAAGWWCDALRGLALHEAERYADAQRAYATALAEMDPGDRCTWLDLSDLLDGALAHAYAKAECSAWPSLDARLWWIAQPFLALDANDLETEHDARLTMVDIAMASAWPEADAWSDDLRELMVRYGWPRWFERERPPIMSDQSYSIMGHDPQPSYAFFPGGHALDSLFEARPDDWDLHAAHAQSRYAPPYAEALEPVTALLSRFRRGDSEIVVAAFDVSGDSVLAHAAGRAALVLAPDERRRYIAWRTPAPPRGAIRVTAPAAPVLAGVELFADRAHVAGRYRIGMRALPAPAPFALSDLLLFHPGAAPPASLAEAADSAAVPVVGARSARVGVYWELYGIPNNVAPVAVALTVRRTGATWWQRARWALHLGGRDAPIALRWNDIARSPTGVSPRSITLDLSRLDGGTYTVQLTVTPEGEPPLTAERTLHVNP